MLIKSLSNIYIVLKGNDPIERQRIIRQQQQIEAMIRQQRLGGMPQPQPAHHHHHQPVFPQGDRLGAVDEWQDGLMVRMGELIRMRENIRQRQRAVRRREMQALQDLHELQRVPLFPPQPQPAQAVPHPPQIAAAAAVPAVPPMPGPVQPPPPYQAHAFVPDMGYHLNARQNRVVGRGPAAATAAPTAVAGGAINPGGNRVPLPQVHVHQRYMGRPNPFVNPNPILAHPPPAHQMRVHDDPQHPLNRDGVGNNGQGLAAAQRPAVPAQAPRFPIISVMTHAPPRDVVGPPRQPNNQQQQQPNNNQQQQQQNRGAPAAPRLPVDFPELNAQDIAEILQNRQRHANNVQRNEARQQPNDIHNYREAPQQAEDEDELWGLLNIDEEVDFM